MNNNRKWIVRIVTALVALLFLFSMIYSIAFAEGNMTVSGNISQGAQPGDTVTVTVTLKNGDNDQMDSIRIEGNGVTKEVGSIDAGQSKQVTFEYKVNEYDINDGVAVAVYWVQDGEDYSGGTTVSVPKVEATPSPSPTPTQTPEAEGALSVQRSISKMKAVPGDEVTVTYRIRNTGNVDLTNVSLTDAAVANGTIANGLTIAVGERSKEFEKKIVITANMQDIVSEPKAVGTDPNGTRVNGTAEVATIAINAPRLDLEIVEVPLDQAKVDNPALDSVQSLNARVMNIRLTNSGSVTIENITLQEEGTGYILGDNVTLEPGANVEYTRVFEVNEARDYVLSYIGMADGEEIKGQSEALTLEPVFTEEDVKVAVSVDLDQAVLDEPSDMGTTITLNNTSPVALQNVTIIEKNRNIQLDVLDTLPEGQTQKQYQIPIDESGEIAILVTAETEDGKNFTFESAPVMVTVYAGPVASPSEVQSTKTGVQSFVWLMVLIASIILIVALLIALIVVLVRGRKKNADEYAENFDDEMLINVQPKKQKNEPMNPKPSERVQLETEEKPKKKGFWKSRIFDVNYDDPYDDAPTSAPKPAEKQQSLSQNKTVNTDNKEMAPKQQSKQSRSSGNNTDAAKADARSATKSNTKSATNSKQNSKATITTNHERTLYNNADVKKSAAKQTKPFSDAKPKPARVITDWETTDVKKPTPTPKPVQDAASAKRIVQSTEKAPSARIVSDEALNRDNTARAAKERLMQDQTQHEDIVTQTTIIKEEKLNSKSIDDSFEEFFVEAKPIKSQNKKSQQIKDKNDAQLNELFEGAFLGEPTIKEEEREHDLEELLFEEEFLNNASKPKPRVKKPQDDDWLFKNTFLDDDDES